MHRQELYGLPMATIARLRALFQRAEPLTPQRHRSPFGVSTPVHGLSQEDANMVSVGKKNAATNIAKPEVEA